jgi:DNA modification methylase
MIQRGLEFGDAPDYEILAGDCREVMAAMDAESVDSIVSDPPYGLSAAKNSGKSSSGGFMGKEWDHGVPGVEFWAEALRVAKPGAHLLAFGGTRTYHRLACAIEDAGWEIRDCVMWVTGSGFPKSHNVSVAIDKAAGAERELVERVRPDGKGAGKTCSGFVGGSQSPQLKRDDAPATPEAQQWAGWGTALKPSYEPVIVARKPLIGTVAQNVLKHGTGGLNIDGCRVGTEGATKRSHQEPYGEGGRGDQGGTQNWRTGHAIEPLSLGRWPANLIHDGSDEVVGLFPNVKTGNVKPYVSKSNGFLQGCKGKRTGIHQGDSGSAARFFYCPKASRADRDADNKHPCVKPTALMRYLCRLVTPPGGIVLDPFMGSGSTGKAAMLEGFRFIGIEREAEYVEIARARIGAVLS